MPSGDRKLRMDEMDRVAPEQYSRTLTRRITVVLDDVRSRHNVGSVFRTADAFGSEELLLCGLTPLPPHREIEKTALGATNSVPWRHVADAAEAVRALQERGYRVLAVEQTLKAVSLGSVDHDPEVPLALVFGNELRGVDDAVIAACDGCVVVPQLGSKHSLNVSVCVGVVIWWFASKQANGGPWN